MFSRVLIANRGEIAVRVARTLRRLGIEAIAVHSDADAGAPHVRTAGRAVAVASYLDIEGVIAAALRAGADAVHPGYGFLSERPAFARACRDAGLVFVGPSPEAMALLGDKVAAKEAAVAAGVPVLPGTAGEEEEIAAWAGSQTLPLMVKAAGGGGGRGMRIVRSLEELEDALAAARREAAGAFGDDRLLVERYLERARHIEVQVIADGHGTTLHLGERECSLQRRHQKVIEEAPSPVVDAALRERMGAAAVALAAGCGYEGAGTVELLASYDDPSQFFFLEMNARLQVEHPVTEAVTGLDLVELQLRVAAGEPFGLAQEDVVMQGHAVEARVYAENPAAGFLPAVGRVVAYRSPDGVRVDSGIEEGVEVGGDYDPLLAKAIAHAPSRAEALARLDRALGELVVLGPTTNVAYLRALLARPEVRAGEMDTGLIERLGGEVAPPTAAPELPAVALAILLGAPASDDPWDARDGWRLGERAWIRGLDTAVRARPDGAWEWENGSFRLDGELLTVDGETRRLGVFGDGEGVWLLDGACAPVRFAPAPPDRAARSAAAGSLEAPMPGTVIDVRVAAGDAVEEGDVLVVLESMKMELAVQSPGAGVVADVLVAAGDRVTRSQSLVVLDGSVESSPRIWGKTLHGSEAAAP
jgi:acetyl-CoA/propionyl-CoA carboxylase biotin carboxyl carrier protein